MSQSLFTVQTPVLANNSDGAPGITTATTVRFAQAGTVSGIRFFATTVVSGTYTVLLYHVDTADNPSPSGTLLASKTMVGSPTGGAWNVVSFDTPVSVSTGNLYRASLFSGAGRYVATLNFFTVDLVNGDITADANGDDPVGLGSLGNGTFVINAAPTYPGSGGSTCYFVDVVFDVGGPEQNLAVNLTATGGMSAALANEARLSAALTATGGLSAAMVNETKLSAALTATGGMSAALTVPSGPVDPIGTPVAQELLTCFTDQLLQLPSPPALIQLRVGQETGPLIGPNTDECCAGLAWVRIAGIYPSWDSFPGPDNTWLPCGPLAYAVVLEMGVAFCMPWSDSGDSFENLDPPSTADWATAAATQMQHQTLMRRAAACCWRPTQRRAVGEWSPLSVEGGCTGGTLRVTVSVMAPCGDC